MVQELLCCLVPIVLGVVSTASVRGSESNELLLYISSFTAGDGGSIRAFQFVLDSGELKFLSLSRDAEQPFFLALSRDRRFLYATQASGEFGGKEDEAVASFQLVDNTGGLRFLNRQSSRGTATCYVDVDATGQTVVVANYSSGSLASFPIRPDGSLGEATSFVQHSGSSVNRARQEGPHAHCIVVSPDNRFAYSADLGLDQVLGYRLDAERHTLAPSRQAFVRTPPGAGPRHLTFHPKHPYVYVINELANSITMFERDPDSGALYERQTISTLPRDFAGTSYCADLKISPDGRFLYGTNRGHHSIATFRIGDDGKLTVLEIVPSRGDGPQNLAITPGGEFLLCANMPGNNVAVFRIDPKEGRLRPVGQPFAMPAPSCIQIR